MTKTTKVISSIVAAIGITAAVVLLTGSSHKSFSVGTGSGSLLVDNTKIGANGDDTIKIKGGSYSAITIQNFNTSGGNVIIEDSGLVQISGNQNAFVLSNLSNVVLTGTGPSSNNQGFYLHDNNYRPLQMQGVFHNFTLDHFLFKNTGDYVISSNFNTTVYKDTTTAWSDIHILYCEFNNTGGTLQLDGNVVNGQITGLIKRLEIAYCYFHDQSPGDLVWAGAVDQYSIHHNIVNNVNTTNNNDNGIFHMQGNGTFAYNKVTNHQGHTIRAWLVSFGSTVEQELIYNNIVLNSRKYSAFEVQSFTSYFSTGKATFANARIFGNTTGNINLSKDPFPGVVVDVYGLFGGTCAIFDNLGFNFPVPNPASNIFNQENNTTPTESNDLYFANNTLAGFDTTALQLVNTSPAIGKGISDASLTDDYYGTKRSTLPSIGAIEYMGGTVTPPPVVITYNSVTTSGTFMKNNCASGYMGNQVLYMVPAGKYTSTISQAAANAQAQADVTANGQAYANANGSCTLIPIVTPVDSVIATYILTVQKSGAITTQKQ